MKRKDREEDPVTDEELDSKRCALSSVAPTKSAFRPDLFSPSTLSAFKAVYRESSPYRHAVVPSLIDPALLRSVRDEIETHVSFAPKETDIYRIWQSGDLANLSNLESESLRHLPSLLRLRDALYSDDFRQWISEIADAGPLSGTKTDMAVNIYTPGSYLLCHDDVIGTRRVSYILYLTDSDNPWQPDWGGGLRLYDTEEKTDQKGHLVKVPMPEHSLNIPPSFGQLAFFAVQPGESYHDVEEVYYSRDSKTDGTRMRMAISGWFHIPQEGERGYQQGQAESQAWKSSLAQLKGAAAEFDEPQPEFQHFDEPRVVNASDGWSNELDPGDEQDSDQEILTEQDLTFLLQFIGPSFLVPDMTERLASAFVEESVIRLEQFFCRTFEKQLREEIEQEDNETTMSAGWAVARPPHKHRYGYLKDTSESAASAAESERKPIVRLVTDLLCSHAFKKWLAIITGYKTQSLVRQNSIARRFRRGKDYALASPYTSEIPRLEFSIGMTPTRGWEPEQASDPRASGHTNGHDHNEDRYVRQNRSIEVGGEEVYMAGDDEDADGADLVDLPNTGRKGADPAVYQSAGGDDDDAILLADVPGWNRLTVVLRDKGSLRFVKYVSQAAPGDRWDVKGEIELSEDAFGSDEGDEVDDAHHDDDDNDDNATDTGDDDEGDDGESDENE